jgi:hypothetical protein
VSVWNSSEILAVGTASINVSIRNAMKTCLYRCVQIVLFFTLFAFFTNAHTRAREHTHTHKANICIDNAHLYICVLNTHLLMRSLQSRLQLHYFVINMFMQVFLTDTCCELVSVRNASREMPKNACNDAARIDCVEEFVGKECI